MKRSEIGQTVRWMTGLLLLILALGGGTLRVSAAEQEAETTETETEEETQAEVPEPALTASDITLEVGCSKILRGDGLPDGVTFVSWSSSDETVASVSVTSKENGKVTALLPGTAVITAGLSDGTKLTCKVTVPKASPYLSASEATLLKGDTLTLRVYGIDSGASVTWSSSKKTRATAAKSAENAAECLVTAVSGGSVTITAKIGSLSISCAVTVLELNKTDLYLLEGSTYTLKASNYTGAASFSSDNTSVATVSSGGVVTAKKSGSTTIRMKANGVTVTCPVTVSTASLSVTQKNLTVGESFTITTGGSAKAGTWSSSDESKMTVSKKGKCTAVASGEVYAVYTVGDSEISCYVVIARKTASNTFGSSVTQASVGISSLRNYALGSSSRYRFLQGSCTDGTYGYFLLGDKNYQPECAIIKVRLSTWKVVKKQTGLKLYHGNDMACKGNYLLVANGDGNKQTITYVGKKTLKIKKTVTLDEEVYGLTYNKKKNYFVVGVSNSNEILVKNSSWKTVRSFTALETRGYTRQGLDCDNSYIYVLQSYLSKGKTRILVYTWKGTYVTQISLSGNLEAESLFHVGNRYIVSYNDSSYGGGCIYTTAVKHYYLVQYDAGSGKGTPTYKMVKTGSGFKTASCKFTRKGYKFAGWSAKRSSDGKTAYRNTKTKKIAWYKRGSQPKNYELYLIGAKKKISAPCSTDGDCVTLTASWTKK